MVRALPVHFSIPRNHCILREIKGMKKAAIASFVVVLATFGVLGDEIKDEVLKNALVSFAKDRNAGLIPGLSSNSHGKIVAFIADDQHRAEQWFDNCREIVSACRTICVVRVEAESRFLMLLYCADARPYELICHTSWRFAEQKVVE